MRKNELSWITRYKGFIYPMIGDGMLWENSRDRVATSRKLGGYIGKFSWLPYIGLRVYIPKKHRNKPFKDKVIDTINNHPEMIIKTMYFDDCGTDRTKEWYDENPETRHKIYLVYSTLNGGHIGDIDRAYNLALDGIHQIQPINLNTVCSIGFQPLTNSWFGWSHRAISHFTIGSMMKKGMMGYEPANLDDWIDNTMEFFDANRFHLYDDREVLLKDSPGAYHKATRIKTWFYDEEKDISYTGSFHDIPPKFGKGEWTAKTLEDAQQMAVDFAVSVS